MAILAVLLLFGRNATVAYLLAGGAFTLFALPSWVVPLRRAEPDDRESILQSFRRHYHRVRK